MICADGRVVAQRGIVVSKLSADRIFVGDSDGTGFDFTGGGKPLTALPAILTALNATYTRNSVKNVVQNGALVSLSAKQFGTSYDPVAETYGYVPEPAATNLATYSDGNVATYTVSSVTDGTAVPGFTNGLAFGNNSVQRSATKSISVTSGTAYSISFFVIMDDAGAPVVGTTNSTGDFSIALNAVIATTKLERLIGSNVYRVSASITASATASHAAGCIKYTTQSARTFRITGIQVETGLRATSYITTTGSTASRAADVLTVPLANITGYNSAGYTLYCDQRSDIPVPVTAALISVYADASNSNYLNRDSGGNFSPYNIVGGAVVAFTNAGEPTGITRKKVAATFTATNVDWAVNGVAKTLTTDAPALCPSPTTLYLGQRGPGYAQSSNFIFRAQLIPTPLTQAQLNGLTT